jgi:NAD(P)-dependent dehydrogenase (short-subunit alcohol dehydrogenase family)
MVEFEKAVLITGGAQGIGKATALRFLEAGFRVMLTDVDEEAGRETTAEMQSAGELLFTVCDVAHEEAVVSAVATTLRLFGRLDVLVNNAGIMIRKPLEELSLEEWRRVLDVNLTGMFLCAKHSLPHLRQHPQGQIVNIASTRALMSEPHTESYSASKGGIVALTHALAMSAGPEVCVNCVSPGWIDVSGWKKKSERRPAALTALDHGQHPAGRVGRPEDVADAVLFLAGRKDAFITGANLVVDGGMTRKMIYTE